MPVGMTLLSADQVQAELAVTAGWELADGQITKTVTHKDFAAALRYVNAVGYLAEKANHHPDIAVSWNKVTLTLVSHSAGGLTDDDFSLARSLNALD
jgi:4a-hydroxytetrahydrobiopterin dehydratase